MGDVKLGNMVLEEIYYLIQEVGKDLIIREFTYGTLDPNNPGAGKPKTPVNHIVQGIMVNLKGMYFKGVLVQENKSGVIIDVKDINFTISLDNKFVDGSKVYEIKAKEDIEISGVNVGVILEIK